MHNQTPNTKPRWTPPHCPNPDCPGHDPGHVNWRYRRRGSFRRKRPPHIIPRYQCLICKRTFSNQTFCTTYWLKRAELQISIAELAVGMDAMNVVGVWPQVPIHAVATHGQDNFAIATGSLDENVEAIFVLDEVPEKWKGFIATNAEYYQK